jgi:hypothetical protein
LLFAIAARLGGGLAGISALAALVIASTYALLHAQLVREGCSQVVAAIVALAAAWAASAHWLARPLLFTVLFALLYNRALRRYETDLRWAPLTAQLAILMLLWANLHAGFVFGFALVGVYWLGALLETFWLGQPGSIRKVRVLAAAGLLCLVVSLVNPNGFRLHAYVIGFLQSDYLRSWFSEYASTNFQDPASRGFLAWIALAFITLAWARPTLRPSGILLLISWSYFALYAVRNIPLAVVLTAPLLAQPLSEACTSMFDVRCSVFDVQSQPSTKLTTKATSSTPRAPHPHPALFLVAILALLAILYLPRTVTMPAAWWPVDARNHVARANHPWPGTVLNQFVWGGYLMQYLPEHRVFIDGRADFYGPDLLAEFSDATALKPGWERILARYRVGWTLMPTDHRLNIALGLASGWEQVYSDEVAMVYRRRTSW